MSNFGTSTGTTQPFIPVVPPTQIGRYAGLHMHFPTLADLNTAVVAERSNIGLGSAMWADGQSFTVGTETASRTRRLWSVSGQHARTVVVNGSVSLILTADANAVLSGSGIPASGTGADGDVSIDQATATAYRKTTGAWASAVTWGGTFIGGTLTAPLVLAGDGTTALNPVSLQQLQAAMMGVGKRSRTRVMSRTNVTIATALVPGQVLDGVTLVAGDAVLLTGQTTAGQNGVYNVAATPVRATEFDTWAEFPGSIVGVYEGTTNGDSLWFCSANDGGTLGTTGISFIQFTLTPVVNDLTTGGAASALSAEQGKQLNVNKAPISKSREQSTSYTLTAADEGWCLENLSGNPIVYTVPAGIGLVPGSFNVIGVQFGSGGSITFAAGSGVTIGSSAYGLTTAAKASNNIPRIALIPSSAGVDRYYTVASA